MTDSMNEDSWLTCLAWLLDYHGVRRHPQQLLAGQPLQGGQLDAGTAVRAAQDAGFDVRALKLAHLTPGLLPVLAQDKAGAAVILTECTASGFTALRGAKGTLDALTPSELEPSCWVMAPRQVTDSRSENLSPGRAQHWLWNAIFELKPWYRDLLLASFVINVLALMVPLFTMNVYDRVVPNQAFDTLWALALGVTVAIAFDWLLRKARAHLTDRAAREIDVKISSRLYAKVLGMELEQRPQSAGAYAKQVQEFDSVREFLTSATLNTAIDLPFSVLFLLLIAWLGGVMVVIPLLAIVGLVTLSLILQSKIKGTIEESSRLSTQRQATLVEQLQLLTDTKQFNAQGESQRRWEQTVAALSDWQIKSRDYANTLSYTVMNVQHLVTIGLVAMGVFRIGEGLLSMGGLIAIVMLSGRAASAINQLAMLLMRYEQTRTAIQGLETVMVTPQEQHPDQAMASKTFTGKLALKSIAFCYPGKEHPDLQSISIDIDAGERVAIVGSSGAGKSTLLALLARQYRPTAGQIYYDGIEGNQWPVSALRAVTGWMGQHPQLRFGSVLDNITLGRSSLSQSQLGLALRDSGVDQFIDRLDNGLETQVGELGRHLSGGQRQAVALARALIGQPGVLLLDEPTSSMDHGLESAVVEGLRNQPDKIGMVVVTHNQRLLNLCQRVIVLDEGKLVVDGPRAEVLARYPALGRASRSAGRKSRVRSVQVSRVQPSSAERSTNAGGALDE